MGAGDGEGTPFSFPRGGGLMLGPGLEASRTPGSQALKEWRSVGPALSESPEAPEGVEPQAAGLTASPARAH